MTKITEIETVPSNYFSGPAGAFLSWRAQEIGEGLSNPTAADLNLRGNRVGI